MLTTRNLAGANDKRRRVPGSTVMFVLWLFFLFVAVAFACFISCAGWSAPRDGTESAERLASQPASMWVAFAPGSADVESDSVMELRSRMRDAQPGSLIAVMGLAHERVDLVANLDLADERARAVAAHLLQMGIIRERIKLAAAESVPVGPGSRAEIRFFELARTR